MVVLPGFPSIRAAIAVNGVPLTEYADEDEAVNSAKNEVTKYVQCEEGAHFAVQYTVDQSYPFWAESILCQISLDGKLADSPVLDPLSRLQTPTGSMGGWRFFEHGTWKQRDFHFAKLITGESSTWFLQTRETFYTQAS